MEVKEIRLLTQKDGKTIFNVRAKTTTTLDEVCEFAEHEFYGGYADFVEVKVNGHIYIQFEE